MKHVQEKYIPLVNWKACKAHLSAASLTGEFPSFKHSASAGPKIIIWVIRAEGFACNIILLSLDYLETNETQEIQKVHDLV